MGMPTSDKVLLVAKPWRGGLADYVYRALNSLFPGRVEWIPTRPTSFSGRIAYRRNKKEWNRRLTEKIAAEKRNITFFINHLSDFSRLDYHPGNILWLTDGPSPVPGEYAPYAKVFLSDPGYLDAVASVVTEERLGGELGFACCPEIHKADTFRGESKGICFIGNKDPKRDAYIATMLKARQDITVVGNYFLRHSLFWRYPKSFLPSVENAKMGEIYANHKLSLNLHANVVRQGTNMRTFECAAYGIPQLVEYRPGLDKYFDLDSELLTFVDEIDMLEKARVLLSDNKKRNDLAKNAINRVLSEHTYENRLKTILKEI